MIARIGLSAGLLALIALGAVFWRVSAQLEASEAENARLTRSMAVLEDQAAHARMAADVADAYRQRAQGRATALAARVETALTTEYGGCANDPIDPDLLRDLGLDGVR